jgi:hypothetical protein
MAEWERLNNIPMDNEFWKELKAQSIRIDY